MPHCHFESRFGGTRNLENSLSYYGQDFSLSLEMADLGQAPSSP